MSQIRYYTDEHVARAVIYGLRQRGIDVLSVPEAGMMGATGIGLDCPNCGIRRYV